ncbi:PREDICTED: protein PRRC2A-like [Bison bison bison]|uniref:Protein PRRC2A-like n=1 Tax=Bison bison bison TaxID=43346 RepID=A0A6P3I521_BISBB|nr:PREDICTED: protein PRRC2A-like [Bison bison bison]
MGRAVPKETAAARATRALAPPAPRPRQGPGAWPVGGARAEPPPLHAPRARRAPGGAAGPQGLRGCGRGGRGAQDWAGWGQRLRPSSVRSTLLPLPGACTEEVPGASRGWEPGGRATPSDCSDSLCFGQFPTEPPKSVHKEGNTSRPGQGATAKGTPKFTPGIPFPCEVLAPRPGARAQAPLLGSHCRWFRGRPAFLHRGGRGRGALGRQTGGLGGGRGCLPHWKAWTPLPEAELVYLPGGGSVPAPPRALFGNRAEELAARACDHAVRAAPERATPAIQVKAALQRKRVTLTGRALPLSSPAQTERGMSEPEQFHKPKPHFLSEAVTTRPGDG